MDELTESNRPLVNKERRWLKRGLYALVVIAVFIIVFFVYLYSQTDDDSLPPFDKAKVKQLSPEKRRQYDVQLFNQLVVRGEMPLEPRYQLFLKMAKDGFEVAYLTLELFDIRYSDLPKKHPKGIDRLKELAKQGDASAQCFYGLYGNFFESGPVSENMAKEYTKVAARQNHPACLASYGITFADSKQEEIEWVRKSAERGDMIAQLMLAGAYVDGKGIPQNFSLSRCWANEAIIQSETIFAKSHAQGMRVAEDLAERKGKKVVIKQYRSGTNCSELEKL